MISAVSFSTSIVFIDNKLLMQIFIFYEAKQIAFITAP